MRETIEFNGRKYHRYPSAKQSNHRRYYCTHSAWKSNPRTLHRDIWEFHNGTIPAGHHIHHADGDFNNNEISNLVCLSSAAHQVEHRQERSERASTPKHLAHLANIRDLTKKWHKSPEGREWHRQHALNSIRKDLPEKPCSICGTMFKPKITRAAMCSDECKRIRSTAKNREWYARSRVRLNGGV